MTLPFEALAADLLQHSRTLLSEWFPAGKFRGHEFVMGDVHGSEGESCSVNVNTGMWADFSSGDKGGDLISLYAAANRIEQGVAFKALSNGSGIKRLAPVPKRKSPAKRPEFEIIPVPDDAPTPPDRWGKRIDGPDGKPKYINPRLTKRWPYYNADGQLIGYTCRFDSEHGKDIVPQTWTVEAATGKAQWRWKHMPRPRPLYNLRDLLARPDAPVIIVEGEKCADAIASLCKQYVGIAWAGGAQAWTTADWKHLAGRQVLLWPDHDRQTTPDGKLKPMMDQPGLNCMWGVSQVLVNLCSSVKLLIPDDDTLPDGWDAADAVADGWTWEVFKPWALSRVFLIEKGSSNERIKWKRSGDAQGNGGRDIPQERGGGAHQNPQGVYAGRTGGGVEAGTVEQDARGEQADPVAEDADGDGDRDDGDGDGGAGGYPEFYVGTEYGAAQPDQRTAHADFGVGQAAAGPEQSGVRLGNRGAYETIDDPQTDTGGRSGTGIQQPAGQQSILGRWLSWDLERYGNAGPVCNLNNAVKVLNRDPALRGVAVYDEFLGKILTGGVGGEPLRDWRDVDDIRVQLHMQLLVGLSKMTASTVRDAICIVSQTNPSNVARDWLNALQWDNTPRIEQFMGTVFGAADNSYTRAVSRNFWISMVARVFRPGCQVDNMVVLEGRQGTRKSTACEIIGGAWYAEQHESASNPRAFAEILCGKLIVEISELGSFGKAETNQIKRSITVRSDRYRAPYGRVAEDHPRRCILVGTTNRDDWNKDDTGARRFWPIKCTQMADTTWLKTYREQLFAEAVAMFRDGHAWHIVPAEDAEREQAERYESDPWRMTIENWLVGREWTYITEVASEALKIVPQDIDMVKARRIGSVLRELGYVNGGVRRVGSTTVRAFMKFDDDTGPVVDYGDVGME